MNNTYQTIQVELGKVAKIAISVPSKLNALSSKTINDLIDCFNAIEEDESVVLVTIEGGGDKAFVAGADVSEMSTKTKEEFSAYTLLGHQLMSQVEQCSVPVIALVDGFALGGGLELALACDLIYASDKSKFAFPEVALGLIPGFGGTQRILTRVSSGMAKKLIFTGTQILAKEAYRIGLVDELVESENFQSTVNDFIQSILKVSPASLRAAKKVIQASLSQIQGDGLKRERESFVEVAFGEQGREGVSAFLEKRRPLFL